MEPDSSRCSLFPPPPSPPSPRLSLSHTHTPSLSPSLCAGIRAVRLVAEARDRGITRRAGEGDRGLIPFPYVPPPSCPSFAECASSPVPPCQCFHLFSRCDIPFACLQVHTLARQHARRWSDASRFQQYDEEMARNDPAAVEAEKAAAAAAARSEAAAGWLQRRWPTVLGQRAAKAPPRPFPPLSPSLRTPFPFRSCFLIPFSFALALASILICTCILSG